ncbi:MAG TPA: alpha/beta hydrolase [Cyclobacteriaceae bacterium]|nr:alpha/beta hydrolase [Cyclobacteriaceae bacterium]
MSKKKDQTPPILKLLQWGFPKLEFVFPYLAHRLFLQLFFTPINYNRPEKEGKAESFSQTFNLNINGKQVHGYRWGTEGKVVMCIHGWAGRGTQFRRFVKPLLKAGYQVIAFDGPAHGKSQGKRTNILEFEEVLKALVEKFGAPEAVIAHSFGGGVGLFAAMNGLPIKTLINIASPTIGEKIVDTYIKAIGASDKTRAFFEKEVIKRYGKPFYEYTALHFITQLKNDINLLLVHDEDDKEVSIDHPLALIEKYPQAQLYRTSGLGHTRILKDDVVIKKCVDFILLAG